MKLIYHFLILVLFGAISSCSSQDDIVSIDENYVKEVEVVSEPIDEPSLSRALTVVTSSGFQFLFFSTDVLGFFSSLDGTQQSFQMAFPINDPSGNGISSFTFDGGGWRMINGYSYAAYLPFNYDNKDAAHIPVCFAGQTQTGDNNTKDLDPFMYCDQTLPVDNRLSITMKLGGTMAWLYLTLPEETTLKKVVLCSEEDPFVIKTNFNLLTGSFDHTSDICSPTQTLTLNNVNTTNKIVSLFMSACPFSSKSFKIIAVNNLNETYVGNVTNVNFPASNGRRVAASLTKTPVTIPPVETVDGITGSAPDFVPVGGSTTQPD